MELLDFGAYGTPGSPGGRRSTRGRPNPAATFNVINVLTGPVMAAWSTLWYDRRMPPRRLKLKGREIESRQGKGW
jgi:hypothetical protein